MTSAVHLALNTCHASLVTKVPPSAHLPGGLAPTVATIARVDVLPVPHSGVVAPSKIAEQGTYCRLPRFAKPRRAHRNPCFSCEEGRLQKCRSTEATKSRPFYTRVPPRSVLFRSAAVQLHHTWTSRLGTSGSHGTTAAAL